MFRGWKYSGHQRCPYLPSQSVRGTSIAAERGLVRRSGQLWWRIFLGHWIIKATICPCWLQSYVEKVNKLAISNYSYAHSFDNSALSVPCLLVRAFLLSSVCYFLISQVHTFDKDRETFIIISGVRIGFYLASYSDFFIITNLICSESDTMNVRT